MLTFALLHEAHTISTVSASTKTRSAQSSIKLFIIIICVTEETT